MCKVYIKVDEDRWGSNFLLYWTTNLFSKYNYLMREVV